MRDPRPALEPDLYVVFAGYRQLGRDAGGALLYGERDRWLERHVPESGEREAFDRWFDALEAEFATLQREDFQLLEERAARAR